MSLLKLATKLNPFFYLTSWDEYPEGPPGVTSARKTVAALQTLSNEHMKFSFLILVGVVS